MNLEEAIEATEETIKRTMVEVIIRTMKEMPRMKVQIMRESNVAAIEEETNVVDMTAEGVIKNQEATTEKETTGVDTVVEKAEATTEVTEAVNAVDTEEAIEEDKITEAATTKEVDLATTRARERLAQEPHLADKAEMTDTMASNSLSKKLPKWPLTALK